MRNKITKNIGVFVLIMLSSCSEENKAKEMKFNLNNEYLDLSQEIKGEWERVCVINSYSTNEYAEKILGFKVNIEDRSNITYLDTISLLITINKRKITGMHEIPFSNINFAAVGSNCFERNMAKFIIFRDKHGKYHAKTHRKEVK